MRFLLWVWFFFPLALVADGLVFIHLSKNVPPCLFTTLRQARYLNPQEDIYLLTDPEGFIVFKRVYQKELEEIGCSLINLTKIPQTKEHQYFHQVSRIDPHLLKGFWKYTLERFFYLFDFVQHHNLHDIVHLESDTMLYCTIEELMPFFKKGKTRLAAPFQSAVGCIPCFVFVKDALSLQPLLNHIVSEMETYTGNKAHIDVNDMQTLASFHSRYGDEALLRLPVLMPEYKYPKRVSDFEPDNETSLEFLFSQAALFEGYIFDAASLGVFAAGNDPHYFSSTGPGVIHHRSLFDPGKFSFFWGKEERGKEVPYLSFEGKIYRIVNLHFHSKKPEHHTSYGASRVEFCKGSRE